MLRKIIQELEKTDTAELEAISEVLLNAILKKHTIYTVGNGGSSATMSHLASDLAYFGAKTKCLTDNIPELTAKTNDDGWDNVYTAIVEGKLNKNDILILASVNASAGKSPKGEEWSSNLLNVVKYFKTQGCIIILIAGNFGGNILNYSDYKLTLLSKNPYVVESVHSVWCHMIPAYIKGEVVRK